MSVSACTITYKCIIVNIYVYLLNRDIWPDKKEVFCIESFNIMIQEGTKIISYVQGLKALYIRFLSVHPLRVCSKETMWLVFKKFSREASLIQDLVVRLPRYIYATDTKKVNDIVQRH